MEAPGAPQYNNIIRITKIRSPGSNTPLGLKARRIKRSLAVPSVARTSQKGVPKGVKRRPHVGLGGPEWTTRGPGGTLSAKDGSKTAPNQSHLPETVSGPPEQTLGSPPRGVRMTVVTTNSLKLARRREGQHICVYICVYIHIDHNIP